MGTSATNQINQNRVNKFKDLITTQADAASVRQALTRLFMQYSRLLLITNDQDIPRDNQEIDEGMHYLSEIIMLLDASE